MDLILLSGNSKNTKNWIEEVEVKLKPLFNSTHVHGYSHWNTDNNNKIDLGLELKNLTDYLKAKEDYVIFAKSAGAVLTLKGIFEKKIFPLKCVLVGIPTLWCKEEQVPLEKFIKDYSITTVFIQKDNDPLGKADELKNLLKRNNVKNFKIVEIPGEDHHYEDLDQIKEIVKNLIQ